MKPITVYALREIEFPVEQTGDAADQQLLQARAVEAVQFLKKFKGCGNAKAAASGIFDVRVGKQFEADAAKLPKELRKLLDKRGVGNAIGPMRGQKGIQVIAFCSKRTIKPPKPQFEMPTRQQVENAVSNEKYAVVEEKYLKQLRKTALIEYKDQTYAP
jgi:peptidyl-prolyl cis-trans isomerase SurA